MKFCEKNVLCEKGDEITRFDGTEFSRLYVSTEPAEYSYFIVMKWLV